MLPRPELCVNLSNSYTYQLGPCGLIKMGTIILKTKMGIHMRNMAAGEAVSPILQAAGEKSYYAVLKEDVGAVRLSQKM